MSTANHPIGERSSRFGFRGKILFDIAHGAGNVLVLFSHRSDVVDGGLGLIDSCESRNDPTGKILRSKAAARSRDIVFGEEWLIEYGNSSFLDPRLVVRSVHADTPSRSPSFARMSVPEHCAPSSCRAGSSFISPMIKGSLTMSLVRTPLPTITASAELASCRGICASMNIPFMDRTRGVGDAIETRQPGCLTRLRMPSATSESSSLKPSNVNMAMCIIWSPVECDGAN